MFLKSSRYAAILCSPVKSETLLLNPYLMDEVAGARKLLQVNFGHARRASDLIDKFSDILSDETEGSFKEWEQWLSDLTMTAAQLPKVSELSEYEAFVTSHHLLLTEIFSPYWERTLGSARNLQVGNVQMKGCGLTLPAPAYSFMNGSGVFPLALAIKTFIFSGLMDSTLPLGSNRAIAVQKMPWGTQKLPLGIYLREFKFPRMIQSGPELTEPELNSLRQLLEDILGVRTATEALRLYTFQVAAMVKLGGRSNLTPDNMLVSGELIDEETWVWAETLDHIRFSFEFEKETSNFIASTFSLVSESLVYLRKFCGLLYGENDLPTSSQIEEMFLSSSRSLSPGFNFDQIWQDGLEVSIDFDPKKFDKWLEQVTASGWTREDERFKDECFAFHLTKALPSTSEIGERFNQIERPDFWMMAIKLSKLSAHETNTAEISSMLQKLIGESGFVLKHRFLKKKGIVENKLSFKDFIQLSIQKWPVLKERKFDLMVWDGARNILIENPCGSEDFPAECVPLYFLIADGDGKSFPLSSIKTVLRHEL